MLTTEVIAEAGLDAFSVLSVGLMWVCGGLTLLFTVALLADGIMGRARKADEVIEDAMLGNGTSDTAELAASDTQEIETPFYGMKR